MSHPPTAEQAAAITAKAREALLRAGAGSGKTTVLVDRYCDLIAREGLSADQILAFTFTRKAAAQLRERIRIALIERAARETSAEAAARLRDAANRIGAAWVMTIHSFCQAVIAAHPVAAGIDPEFTVIQDLALDKLRNQAFDQALKRFLGDRDEAAQREELVAAYGIDGLRSLVLRSYDELRSHGMAKPALPEPARSDPLELLDRLAEACADLLDSASYKRDKRNHDPIVNLGEIARRGREWMEGAPPAAGPAALLAAVEGNCFNSTVEGKLQVSQLAQAVCRSLHEELSGVDYHRQISLLLDLYGAELTAAKNARSALDFDDLQLLAVRLLSENEAIGDSYRSRFRQIMVDEFQDTAPVQVALIEALKGSETTIFQVGDKFQAIYAFRHADLANFDRVDRRLQSDPEAEVLPLSGNFRSSAAILSVVNELTSSLLPGFPPLRVGSAGQCREPRGGGSAVELILTAPSGWDEADPPPAAPEGSSAKRAAEAEALAYRLSRLVAAGVPRGEIVVLLRTLAPAGVYAAALERLDLRPFVVGGRGFWRGREIIDAVALLGAIANPLDEECLFGALAGPACAASPDALWLLRRAAGRAPVWRAVAALAGDPAAPGQELAAPQWLAEIEAEDRQAIGRLHGHLIGLREERPVLPLAELIETAVTRTGLDLAAAAGARGAAGLAALRKLSRLAGEYEATEGRDLRGFLDHARLQAERGGESEAPIAAEGHDGVRIMTMHAAKGLEFPVVAVPELGRRFGGGPNSPSLRLARRDDGGWLLGLEIARLGQRKLELFDCAAIKELAEEEQSAEELRLFYVAMTRAEERLILSGQAIPPPNAGIGNRTPLMPRLLNLLGIEVEKDGPPPSSGPLIFPPAEPRPDLELELEPAEIELLINWPEPEQRLALASLSAADLGGGNPSRPAAGTADPAAETAQLEIRIREADATAAIEPLADPPPPLPPLSFTSLVAAETAAADPEAVEPEGRSSDELGLDAAGQAYGVAIHALLEQALARAATGHRWRPISDAMILRALAEQGLSDAGLSRARRQIDGWFNSDLAAEIGRPGVRLRAEAPLLLRLDAEGDPILRGSIDLLAEPSRGPALIIDYKTNRLDGRRPQDVAADYSLQADIYALAVSRALAVPEVEVAFFILDAPDQPVRSRFDAERLARAQAGLSERIRRLQSAPDAVSGIAARGAFEAGSELV